MEENEKNKETEDTGTEFLDSTFSLVDLLFQYFETLTVYYHKLLNEKISSFIHFAFTSFVLLFLTLTGISFLLFTIFRALLRFFDGSLMYTSLTMGTFLTIIPVILFIYLTRKHNY